MVFMPDLQREQIVSDEEGLEPLEDIDTAEAVDLEEVIFSNRDDTIPIFNSSVELFENSIFPVLYINQHLKILYANPGCKTLFSFFRDLQGSYFIDAFGKYLTLNEIREIRSTIMKGEKGYSWKGEVRIKSREMVTVQTKVYIFPAEMNIKQPKEFVVMFDDVTEENRQLLRSVFLSLLEASKLKDNDTGKHISRVNLYSRCLAEELYRKPGYERVDADFIDNIGFLASMHDVGKIGTPDDILNKEDPLSDWEWSVMKEHTKNGAFILATYPNPMAKEIALSHHEKWNGSGYPFQLEGNMIPLSARIVAIADVYDALRMRRSYKPPFDHTTAINKMMEVKETHFDPTLLDVFYTSADKFGQLFELNKDL
jgi:putative two-component system response regulator